MNRREFTKLFGCAAIFPLSLVQEKPKVKTATEIAYEVFGPAAFTGVLCDRGNDSIVDVLNPRAGYPMDIEAKVKFVAELHPHYGKRFLYIALLWTDCGNRFIVASKTSVLRRFIDAAERNKNTELKQVYMLMDIVRNT